jgi:uncharacterized protein (TIGR02646 family)
VIPVKRLPKPKVLEKNEAHWCQAFLAEHGAGIQKRPRSARYAHPDVVSTLAAMSHHKCFYCEQSTKQARREVDHYIDIAERPDLAFTWTNLYLSCWECNHHKQPNHAIPVSDCLDPCDPDVRPAEHLTFDDEMIRGNTPKGLATITKYNLGRPELDHQRARQLRQLYKVLIEIQQRMISDSRKALQEDEKEALRCFQQPDRPFSLMFAVCLNRLQL